MGVKYIFGIPGEENLELIKALENSSIQFITVRHEQGAALDVFDVSTSGIGFYCNEALTIGAVYDADLTLWNKDVIHAFIEIVRITKSDSSFQYGGIFIGMPEMDMKRIEIYDTVEQYSKKE